MLVQPIAELVPGLSLLLLLPSMEHGEACSLFVHRQVRSAEA